MNWSDMPPLAGLRAFAAFVQMGGVQEAGSALNVSHAAISQQMRALEAHLGLTLLDRSGRSLQLTEDGRVLASAVTESFSQIHQVIARLTGVEAERPVHVSVTSAFAGNWLMPRLAGFRAEHPNVDLMIDPSSTVAVLEPGGVDVAVRYGKGDWPGLEATHLVNAPVVGVAAPSLVGPDAPRDFAALAELPWFQELGRHEASNWLAAHDMKPATGILSAPGNMLLDSVRAGEGVAIIVRSAVEADLTAGRLICLFEENDGSSYWIVTRPGVLRAPVKAFVNWLKRQA